MKKYHNFQLKLWNFIKMIYKVICCYEIKTVYLYHIILLNWKIEKYDMKMANALHFIHTMQLHFKWIYSKITAITTLASAALANATNNYTK